MATPPNRDIRVTVQHPTTRAAPGDPPLPADQLAGWRVFRTQGGSNTYELLTSTLLPRTQTIYNDLDRPPGTWNYKVEWEDTLGQISSPMVSGVQVPMPAPPASGQILSVVLT